MMTRAEAGVRQRSLWVPGTIPYSQVKAYAGPFGTYRGDCSGFASGTIGLEGPGLSTVELPNVCTVIGVNLLQTGDLIGRMGPGTGGNVGHVMAFEGFTDKGIAIWEQAGGTVGQRRRIIGQIPDGYLCYRPNVFQEPEEDSMTFTLVWDDQHKLWLCNGMFRRHINGDQELKDLLYMASVGAIKLWNNGAFWLDGAPGMTVGQSTAWGIDVATLSAAAVFDPDHEHTTPAGRTGGIAP